MSGALPALALIPLFVPGFAQTVFAQTPLIEGSGDMVPTLPAGPLTEWDVSTLIVGKAGSGGLTIQDGGKVSSSTSIDIGYDINGEGTVRVTGAGSVLTTDQLTVGDRGTGTLEIRDGGRVTNRTYSYIGRESASIGKVSVSGMGSTWDAGTLILGRNGSATLTIENGGTVVGGSAYIGALPAANGSVEVSG